jgi:hypothetical protein
VRRAAKRKTLFILERRFLSRRAAGLSDPDANAATPRPSPDAYGDYLITSTVGLKDETVDPGPCVVPSTMRRERTRKPLLDDVAQMLHGILGNEREDEEIRGTPEYAVARRETTKGPRVAGLPGGAPSYAAIGRSRACSSSRRNSGRGARHIVRYVSRKGSQI